MVAAHTRSGRFPSLGAATAALTVAVLVGQAAAPVRAEAFGPDVRTTVAFTIPEPAGSSGAPAGYSPAATAVGYALSMLGRPYRYGGSSPLTGFDCSGLTLRSYGAAGTALPRTAAQQFAAHPPIPIAEAEPGDLMFWARDAADPASIYHVSLYLGGDRVVSAPSTGDVVRIKPVGTKNLVPFVVRPAPDGAPLLSLPARGPSRVVEDVQYRLRNNGARLRITGVLDEPTRTALARLPIEDPPVASSPSQEAKAGEARATSIDPRIWEWLVAHGDPARAR